MARRLEDVPGAELRGNLHPAAELLEGGEWGEREVGLLAGVGVLVDHVLGHTLGPGPALARGIHPLGLERAVGEGLVRGVHPHRAAALRDDARCEAEVVRVGVGDDEVGDVRDPVAGLGEPVEERVPAGRVARRAAVDERDAALGARQHGHVDVADPGPDERDPQVPETGAHLEDGDRVRVDRADVRGRADHALHASRRTAKIKQSFDSLEHPEQEAR